jgi:hypothetical protein
VRGFPLYTDKRGGIMPKFTIRAEFSLTTEVGPELYGSLDPGGVEDFTDDSCFDSGEVTIGGGGVSFVIEAASEEDAEYEATRIIGEGNEVTDRNDLTWLISDVSFDIEPVEEEMTKERAKLIVNSFLDYEAQSGRLDDEQLEAFRFLLAEL